MEVKDHLPLVELERIERVEKDAHRVTRLGIILLGNEGWTAPRWPWQSVFRSELRLPLSCGLRTSRARCLEKSSLHTAWTLGCADQLESAAPGCN